MGEILGLAVTHGPYVGYPEASMTGLLRRFLESPKTPEKFKDPANWPTQMRAEWGEDEGLAAAHKHRMELVDGFLRVRRVLDEFKPDVVLIWGDDQNENFREDIVPAFCVFAEDQFSCKPWSRPGAGGTAENVWGEDANWVLNVNGSPGIGKALARHLLQSKFDIAYAYKQLHHEFSHAFWRTVVHLDYERKGFPYPVIPFHVNCYGSSFTRGLGEEGGDPPSPSPERCFEIGAATAAFFRESPYRVALIGSSSWGHAMLTKKNYYLWPDVEADKARFRELKAGDYGAWKKLPLSQLEDSGQHELLNWVTLAGAMDYLGQKPDICDFVEAWIFNSCKAFATFPPA